MSGLNGVGGDVNAIAGNTGAIKDSMDITSEDVKYLRDLAEQDTINKYTVAEINIDQSGMQNTIKNGDDIDGFISTLTDAVNEAVDGMTEGVHK
jgi:predicted transcriptional regulator